MPVRSQLNNFPLQLDYQQQRNQSASSFNVNDLPTANKKDPPPQQQEHQNHQWSVDDTEGAGSSASCSVSAKTEAFVGSQSERMVTFNESVKSRHIPLVSSLSQEQRREIWFSPTDMRIIKKEARTIVESLECGIELPIDVGQSVLERHCRQGQTRRKEIRNASASLVFSMQDFQEDLWALYGEAGDITELIARQSSKCCPESQKEAICRARHNAIEAHLINGRVDH